MTACDMECMKQLDFGFAPLLQRDQDDAEAISSRALSRLVSYLRSIDYRFVTPTPATHARILSRKAGQAATTLTDILGWSIPFRSGEVDSEAEHFLRCADAMVMEGALYRSTVRVSSLGGQLFIHSAYPTATEDAVFFGPDSYRFANLIASELGARPCASRARIVDMGTGSGVGAIIASGLCPDAELWGTDINRGALRLADINAQSAGASIRLLEGENLAGLAGPFDLILANPPYIIDADKRAYRHGGGMHGGEVAVNMVHEALPHLAAGGRLILYTGSAIVDGVDRLLETLGRAAQHHGCALSYCELDPDVFGEELEQPAYGEVDRIAAVAALFTRRLD